MADEPDLARLFPGQISLKLGNDPFEHAGLYIGARLVAAEPVDWTR